MRRTATFRSSSRILSPNTEALDAVQLIEGHKGDNGVIIDLRNVSIPTRPFVVAGANDPTHDKAFVNALRRALPRKPPQRGGLSEQN